MNIINSMTDELTRIYDALNAKYYDNKLPDIFITIQSGKKKNSFGWFWKESWEEKTINNNEDEAPTPERRHEINITADFLNRPIENICATLQHEMVHLYCFINDIQDTSNNNVYHNKRFKTEAESRGLIIDKEQTIGYSVTTPSGAFIAFINSLDINTETFSWFRNIKEIDKPTPPKKYYVCPVCGIKAQGKKGLNIICGDCNEQLIHVTDDGEVVVDDNGVEIFIGEEKEED